MHGSRTGRIAMAVLLAAFAACSDDTTDPNSITGFSAALNGASVKPTATSSGATASATLTYTGTTITYSITYSGLTDSPNSAHIHLGGPTQSGGVALNLCGAGTAPACPSTTSGTITGTADNTYVVAPATMTSVVSAMRGFGAYINIHTDAFGGGEIRGNIVGVP